MKLQVSYKDHTYDCDLTKPLDISIPLGQVKCFYAPDFDAQPYVAGDFVGAVKAGAPVNFFNVKLNPHGNGTHTECFGHITLEQESIHEHLSQFHFIAQLVSVDLEENQAGDQVISKERLQACCPDTLPEAIVIRTLPNSGKKLHADYSGTNPPYLVYEAMEFLVQHKVKHLLLDLPSVDKEVDDGKLLCHHLFWKVENKTGKNSTRKDCTITELIYVPNEVEDGLYLLNIQIPSMRLDAAPSKPVLYRLIKN